MSWTYLERIIEGYGLIVSCVLKDSKDNPANTRIYYCPVYNEYSKCLPLISARILRVFKPILYFP